MLKYITNKYKTILNFKNFVFNMKYLTLLQHLQQKKNKIL